jgi:hypothetical protein
VLAVYTAELKEAQALDQLQETQPQIVQQAIGAGADYRLSLDGVQIQPSVLARARLDVLGRVQRALGDLEDAVQCPFDLDGMFQIKPESLINCPKRQIDEAHFQRSKNHVVRKDKCRHCEPARRNHR